MDLALDDEVSVGVHRQLARPPHQPHAPARQRPGERQLGQPLGQRHHRRQVHRRRTAHEHVHRQRLSLANRRRVVDADAPVDLVVQANLGVGRVLVARQLDPVHAQVGRHGSGPLGILRVDLGQRDERAAVHRPALQLRQLGQAGLAGHHRAAAHPPGQHRQRRERDAGITKRPLPERARIDLQLHHPANPLQRVPEDEARPVHGPEQVADHGEAAALHPGEVHRRPAGAEHPAVDGGRLQLGVHLLLDAHQVPVAGQILHAFPQRGVRHRGWRYISESHATMRTGQLRGAQPGERAKLVLAGAGDPFLQRGPQTREALAVDGEGDHAERGVGGGRLQHRLDRAGMAIGAQQALQPVGVRRQRLHLAGLEREQVVLAPRGRSAAVAGHVEQDLGGGLGAVVLRRVGNHHRHPLGKTAPQQQIAPGHLQPDGSGGFGGHGSRGRRGVRLHVGDWKHLVQPV